MIVEKQRVVAERRHCNADPRKIVEVLQHWHLCIACTIQMTYDRDDVQIRCLKVKISKQRQSLSVKILLEGQ